MNFPMRSRSALFFLVLLVGCDRKSDGVLKRPGQPDFVRVRSSNGKMTAAIQQARDSVQTFIDALKSPMPNQTGFAVKKMFLVKGVDGEHIWLSDVKVDAAGFHGIVNNDPVDVKTVKLGDPASVSSTEISDWMFVQDGKLIGGYTIRALFDLDTPTGRRKFEKETGLKP